MHHPGVEAAGHGEGLEVAPQGHGQRQLVHQVHGRAGYHCAAAQVLQAEHCRGGDRAQRLPSWTPGKPARLPASLPRDSGCALHPLCPRVARGRAREGPPCFSHLGLETRRVSLQAREGGSPGVQT